MQGQLDLSNLTSERLASYIEEIIKSKLEEIILINEKRAKEISLLERIIRVEEELKNLREMDMAKFELLEKRIESLQREMDKRFEAMEKRIGSLQREMDKRFEAMDKRFETLQREIDKHFEAIDRRFEALQREMDKRFEAIDKRFEAIEKRFDFMQKFMFFGFSFISILIGIVNFIK